MGEATGCPTGDETRPQGTRPADEAEGGDVGVPEVSEPFGDRPSGSSWGRFVGGRLSLGVCAGVEEVVVVAFFRGVGVGGFGGLVLVLGEFVGQVGFGGFRHRGIDCVRVFGDTHRGSEDEFVNVAWVVQGLGNCQVTTKTVAQKRESVDFPHNPPFLEGVYKPAFRFLGCAFAVFGVNLKGRTTTPAHT